MTGATKEVTIDSLVGEHFVLDACDTFIEKAKVWGDDLEDCEAMRFRLDGITYVALSDPKDGYRSSMDKFYVSPEQKLTNVFPPIRVLARKKADDEWQTNDTLELVDVVTGKVVMEVGTDNSDDYYPSFVSAFYPQNMATNAA